jgi:hypothetical protein
MDGKRASRLPLLARGRVSDHHLIAGAKRQLVLGGRHAAAVSNKAQVKATKTQGMMKSGSVLHELTQVLALVVLCEHVSPIEKKSIIHITVLFHVASESRGYNLCNILAATHVVIIRQIVRCISAKALHSYGHGCWQWLKGRGFIYLLTRIPNQQFLLIRISQSTLS